MRSKILITIGCLLIISTNISGQNSISKVLREIEKNNLELKQLKQQNKAELFQLKGEYTLENPSFEYSYLKGKNGVEGEEKEFGVSQNFDFPTVYSARKKMITSKEKQLEFIFKEKRQNLLFKVNQLLIEYVYSQRFKEHVIEHLEKVDQLKADYKKKLEVGDINILEYNKVTVQSVNTEFKLGEVNRKISEIENELCTLNGCSPIELINLDYNLVTIESNFETFFENYKSSDASLKNIEEQKFLNEQFVNFSRANALPKFNVGYKFREELGQKFNGFQIGMSIPLWQFKNSKKSVLFKQKESKIALVNYKNNLKSSLKSKFESYFQLKKNFEVFQNSINEIKRVELLEKALNYGEISTITFFNEMNFYHEAIETSMFLERELKLLEIELSKYKL